MLVNAGDIFLDFGVDELTTLGMYRNITRRMAVAHIVVLPTCTFHGLANLGAHFDEFAQPKPIASDSQAGGLT